MNPLGGLPRRKKVLEKLTGKALVIDAGNALFRAPGLDDAESKARAKFILETMGTLGTQAMAVGNRDLGVGLPFLLEIAKDSKVKLLSANLRNDGAPVFPASVVLTQGKYKVAVIGVSPFMPAAVADAGTKPKGVSSIPPLAAVADEVKKLKGKADVIIVLAAVPYADALQISTELKTQLDFVLQSSDTRVTMPQLSEGNVVVGSGERGRSMGKLELTLGGKGAWVNAEQVRIDAQQAELIENNLKQLKERRKGITDKAALKDFEQTLADFTRRRDEIAKKAKAGEAPGARIFKVEWVALDANVGDDEALKAQVLKYEPTYAAPH